MDSEPASIGAGTVRVDGATLHYQTRGRGPLLLVLSGGDGDADAPAALARALAPRFTIVTHDRRGLSRSRIDAGAPSPTLATHADDAARLLAALGGAPAFVFGSSIGALIGLELVTRHPETVRRLVAHEPPAWELLPPDEGACAATQQSEAEAAFANHGTAAGLRAFARLAAVDYNDREPGLTLPATTPRREANLAFFFRHDSPAVRAHRLDRAALLAAAARVVIAGSRSQPRGAAYHAGAAAARLLGQPLAELPGNHIGWLLRPVAFAATLAELLAS